MAVMIGAAGRDFYEFLVLEGAPADPEEETPAVPIERQLQAAEVIGQIAHADDFLPEVASWPPLEPQRSEILWRVLETAKGDILAELWWGKWRHMIKRPEHRARVIAWIEEKLGSPISDYGPPGG
jgi:hypothetical protein